MTERTERRVVVGLMALIVAAVLLVIGMAGCATAKPPVADPMRTREPGMWK
jgi:hypothetical protein